MKDWVNHPPASRKMSIKDMVHDFMRLRAIKGSWLDRNRDWISIENAKDEITLKQAILMACRSIQPPTGKMHPHQTKVPHGARKELSERLIQNRKTLVQLETFQELYIFIEIVSDTIPGIGPLTIYDVAQRVGYNLNVLPEHVYLHTGVKMAARFIPEYKEYLFHKYIPWDVIHKSIRKNLTPDEAEDFLCTYKIPLEERWRRRYAKVAIDDDQEA